MNINIHLEERHYFAIGMGLVLFFVSFVLFSKTPLFSLFAGISVLVALSQFFLDILHETKLQSEIQSNFPNFVRNFVGNVKSGIPVVSAAIQAADADYGMLTPYVQKLKYQLEWGVPFHRAFNNFARSTHNPIVMKAISTVIEAEKAGGSIEDVLGAVTDSLVQIQELKNKRESVMHSQIVQNYIIFFVFIIVLIVIQSFLIPYMAKVGSNSLGGLGLSFGPTSSARINFSSFSSFVSSAQNWFVSTNGIFLMLALIQAFFTGIVMGLMTEGSAKYGLKHSIILMVASFFLLTLSQLLI